MAGDNDKERLYDAYLVSSVRIGGRDEWRHLVERWQPRFLGHAWRLLGNTDLAAEAVQEAWVEIFRGVSRLDDANAFPAWALRIVSRRCAKQIKQLMRRREGDREMTREIEGESNVLAEGEQAVDQRALRNAVKTLPAGQRAVIGLFYLEELSVAEVAAVLDIPRGTVKTRLMHARNKLSALLEGDNDEQD